MHLTKQDLVWNDNPLKFSEEAWLGPVKVLIDNKHFGCLGVSSVSLFLE